MSPREQRKIKRHRLAAEVEFYESDVRGAIGCRPEEVSTIGQLQTALNIAEGGHHPRMVRQIAMRYVKAAAESKNPGIAAAAVASLLES